MHFTVLFAINYQLGLFLVNQVRMQLGAKPLKQSQILTQVAQHYAETMAKHHKMGHSVDSTHFDQRIRNGGYHGSNLAENVAEGYHSITDVVQGWIKSAGHFKNLVNPAYTEVGFGMAISKDGSMYWCQDFGNGHAFENEKTYKVTQPRRIYRNDLVSKYEHEIKKWCKYNLNWLC
eukprot:NODE_269_length_11261_cov_0.600359.p10 type:complete len:176 gc:universal NODE_269_length_11261_cov_0.600359:2419-1892(-)